MYCYSRQEHKEILLVPTSNCADQMANSKNEGWAADHQRTILMEIGISLTCKGCELLES